MFCPAAGCFNLTMRFLKGLLFLAIVAMATAYWAGTRPRQTIDWRGAASEISEDRPIDPKDFSLRDANGRELSLAGYRGRPILVNFWASWCPPCVEELPALLRFADRARREIGLETVAISVDERWAPVHKLFREKKFWPRGSLPLTILLNSDASVAGAYGTTKYPESFFIDRNYKVIRKFVGPQNWTSREIMTWIAEHSR